MGLIVRYCGQLFNVFCIIAVCIIQVVDAGPGFNYTETAPPEPLTGLQLTDGDSRNR